MSAVAEAWASQRPISRRRLIHKMSVDANQIERSLATLSKGSRTHWTRELAAVRAAIALLEEAGG